MRKKLWQVDKVIVDLEDRDAAVTLVHKLGFSEVTIRFRLKPEQLISEAMPLRRRVETLAAEIVLDLGSFFDSVSD
jgi:hypothetical protein